MLGFLTENGWPSCDAADCDTNPIPGTNAKIPLQRGIPNTILKAFAGVLNVYVESADNSRGYTDEGGWTPTNSKATSNHLGGTAFDYNWSDHPMGPKVPDPAAGWQWSEIVGGPEEARVREVLDYFTYKGIQLVWWGNDWTSPHDSMHFQMGYNTYNNQDICNEYIQKFINPDGTSKFMQDKFGTTGSASAALQKATGLSANKVAQILPTLQEGLLLAQCNTVNRIAMFIAQTRQESDNYNATEEYGRGVGKAYAPYCGRTWIQITWQSNYADFGKWAASQGLISDPNQFVNDPSSLADIKWAGIGAAWYWTVQRPQINSLCDNGDIVGVTKAINGGTNGLDVRTKYWNQALAAGTDLLALVQTDQNDQGEVITLADVTRAEWDALVADVKEIRSQLNGDGVWPQTGNDAKAIQALEDLRASGKPMSLLDMVTWLKLHVTIHKAPR